MGDGNLRTLAIPRCLPVCTWTGRWDEKQSQDSSPVRWGRLGQPHSSPKCLFRVYSFSTANFGALFLEKHCEIEFLREAEWVWRIILSQKVAQKQISLQWWNWDFYFENGDIKMRIFEIILILSCSYRSFKCSVFFLFQLLCNYLRHHVISLRCCKCIGCQLQ